MALVRSHDCELNNMASELKMVSKVERGRLSSSRSREIKYKNEGKKRSWGIVSGVCGERISQPLESQLEYFLLIGVLIFNCIAIILFTIEIKGDNLKKLKEALPSRVLSLCLVDCVVNFLGHNRLKCSAESPRCPNWTKITGDGPRAHDSSAIFGDGKILVINCED